MADERIMDVIHVTVLMPEGQPDEDYDPARKVLGSDEFLDRLRRGVMATIRVYPELARARITVSG